MDLGLVALTRVLLPAYEEDQALGGDEEGGYAKQDAYCHEQAVLLLVAVAIIIGSIVVHFGVSQEAAQNQPRNQADADSLHTSEAVQSGDVYSVAPLSTAVGSGVESSGSSSGTSFPASQRSDRIVVDVQGAVEKPDVYWFEAGAIVQDAITKAGGATEDAELEGLNRAARLVSHSLLYVPRKGEVVGSTRRRSSKVYLVPSVGALPLTQTQLSSKPRKININTASPGELKRLPGIGDKLAQGIVEYRRLRPFRAIEEIQNVPRIGQKTFERIRELITVK